MPNVLANYLFLAALFFPTAGLVGGILYLLVPTHRHRTDRAHAVEAKAH